MVFWDKFCIYSILLMTTFSVSLKSFPNKTNPPGNLVVISESFVSLLNLGKNNEDFSSIFNIDQQIEDTDRLPIYKNNDFPSIFNTDHQIEDIDILQNCKNNDDFTSFDIRFKHLQYIENMNDDPMISVRYMSEDKEIKEENEQNPNDKALDEINTLENKVTSNKTTNKINIIEKINPSFGPENEFICKKRKKNWNRT